MAVQLSSIPFPSALKATPGSLTHQLSAQNLKKGKNVSNSACVTIPVIENVKTDAEVGLIRGVPEKICLLKVIKLLTDPHSVCLVERHLQALYKITQHYHDGFIMRELASVFRILNICADLVQQNNAYIDPMKKLLTLCSLPFLQEKFSDQLTYEQIAIECVDQLAYLMRVPDNTIRLQICETLKHFVSFQCTYHQGNCQPTSVLYNQTLVEKSEVVQTLVQVFDFKDVSMPAKLGVVDLLRKLSQQSELNCNKLLLVCGAQKLCMHMLDSDSCSDLLFLTVEVLWNILECGDTSKAADQLSSVDCVRNLHTAFMDHVTQGFSSSDKQLRNDLLVICTLVLSHASVNAFIETGFAKQLAVLATFQEVKCHHALVKHLKLTSDHEDFELKKLLINSLVLLGCSESSIAILSECRVLHALFTYIRSYDTPPPSYSPLVWSPAQLEEIALHAMSALATLAPSMLTDYMECQGGTRLLVMLEWCISESDYSSTGNGFHSSGFQGGKRAHLFRIIHIIHNIVCTGDQSAIVDLIDQGLIVQLLSLLEMFLNEKKSSVKCMEKCADSMMSRELKLAARSVYSESEIDVEVQTEILVTLSMICQDDNNRKELFGRQGVDLLCEYLLIDRDDSSVTHLRQLLAAVNTVWLAVVGCYAVEEYFLAQEGAFILMDLLQSCSSSVHGQLLGCIVDLLDNPRSLPHIQSWRGPRDMTPTHLLCSLWRDEEKRLGVQRDPHGAISDIDRPLSARLCHSSPGDTGVTDCETSEAISDVLENIRAKIYAVFSRIGFTVEEGLSAEDHVTLIVIQHYLDLKTGEVWGEVMENLERDCVRPITPDSEALEAISSAVHIRSSQIKELQKEIVEAHHNQDLQEEKTFYQTICESQIQKEKLLQLQTEYLERTSKHMILKAAKEKQNMAIEASRVNAGYSAYSSLATLHKTDVPNLNVTTFCGRHVVIDHKSNLNVENDVRTSAEIPSPEIQDIED